MKMGWIALLGRRDTPTDGVEDYCTFLGRALEQRGVALKQYRVNWLNRGWIRALWQLRRDSDAWRGQWILFQYTALGWSRRGFPLGALAALWILRHGGVRCAVVFHESFRQGDQWPRRVDKVRGAFQDWVIRRLYSGATRAIFTIPLARVSWLPRGENKAASVPIGANIPELAPGSQLRASRKDAQQTVVVFCLSGPPHRSREVAEVSVAIRSAALVTSGLRIVFLGRGTAEAQEEIEHAFREVPVDVSNLGLVSAEQVANVIAGSDVMLCVRGKLNQCRGTAIAGIACGLPVIGYAGAAEDTPLAEAGVLLVPHRDAVALGAALSRLLAEPDLSAELRGRSSEAQQRYFSWDSIAAAFVADFESQGHR